jgi:hypothetical protein
MAGARCPEIVLWYPYKSLGEYLVYTNVTFLGEHKQSPNFPRKRSFLRHLGYLSNKHILYVLCTNQHCKGSMDIDPCKSPEFLSCNQHLLPGASCWLLLVPCAPLKEGLQPAGAVVSKEVSAHCPAGRQKTKALRWEDKSRV